MMMRARPPRQQGIALPVMLIMLTVMMVSSIYLLRSSTSTTLTTSNLAYDAALSKAADAGVHAGFAWLAAQPKANLQQNGVTGSGYIATLTPTWTVSTPAFWVGATAMPADASGNVVQYVIHRMCSFAGAYNATVPVTNRCTLTAAKQGAAAAPVALGTSLGSSSAVYAGQPQLHYVVTARVIGPRGNTAITQAVVMMGP